MKSTATTTEGVDPIKEQHVQVNIQVQRGAEALDHRQYLSQYVRLGCEQESQRKRKRQHELTNGRYTDFHRADYCHPG